MTPEIGTRVRVGDHIGVVEAFDQAGNPVVGILSPVGQFNHERDLDSPQITLNDTLAVDAMTRAVAS